VDQSDFITLYEQLIGQLGTVQEAETPQLGRVTYQSPMNIAAGLALLRQEAALAAGVSTTGVFTIGYCRGLGPSKGGCL
jgi:hypothetical protein